MTRVGVPCSSLLFFETQSIKKITILKEISDFLFLTSFMNYEHSSLFHHIVILNSFDKWTEMFFFLLKLSLVKETKEF